MSHLKPSQLDARGGPAKTNTIQMKKLLKLMLISISGDFGFTLLWFPCKKRNDTSWSQVNKMRVVNSTESNLYSIFFCGLKNLNEELKAKLRSWKCSEGLSYRKGNCYFKLALSYSKKIQINYFIICLWGVILLWVSWSVNFSKSNSLFIFVFSDTDRDTSINSDLSDSCWIDEMID